jgi:multiple sugar transport system substrate-binding protein
MYEYPEVEGNVNYEEVFKEGMDLVPTNPPPIPADTPQNMEIMSQVANAMSRTVANGPENAKLELDAIEEGVGRAAKRIPERYIDSSVNPEEYDL